MVHHPKWLLASFIVEKCARRLDHLNLWPCRHVASVGKTSFPVFLHGILQESTGRTCPPPEDSWNWRRFLQVKCLLNKIPPSSRQPHIKARYC